MKYLQDFRLYLNTNRLIVIGLILGLQSWIVESFVHSQIFYDNHSRFITHLLHPDIHELWMRLIIISLFVCFGVYSQRMVRALCEAEQRIKAVNIELTQIFDTAADGMRVIDLDFNVLRANSTFLRLAQAGKDDIGGLKCFEVFRGSSCHTDLCPMLRIQKGEDRVEYDSVKECRDGQQRSCIVTATPFCDNQGKLLGIVENFKDITDRKKTEEALQFSHEQLRKVTSHLEIAREQERRAIAREIHDELGQSLAVLKMDVHWLLRHLPNKNDAIHTKLLEMDTHLEHTVRTVQRLVAELRPCLLDDLGLSAAIEWLANKVHERLGITIDVVSKPEDIKLDDSCNITVFRIFQEALTNISRHSEASQVDVRLELKDDVVTMCVKDNGGGMTEEQMNSSNAFGLIGMRERTAHLNGELEITSEIGRGTAISLTIPVVKGLSV